MNFREGKPRHVGKPQGKHHGKPHGGGGHGRAPPRAYKKTGNPRPQPRHEPEPEPTVSADAPRIPFADMDISDETKAAIEAMGFVEATPIQGETIPLLMSGRDVIGMAQTGTGKTAAFGVPIIEAARAGVRSLVLAPTRELAKQVQVELQALSKGSPVEAICIVGGAPFHTQLRAMERHPDAIIVATPGRIVDHLGRGTIDLSRIGVLVLDEADEMLSMGFQDELDAIVEALPEERQNVLFSATMPKAVERLAQKALVDPATVRVARGAGPDIRQGYAIVAGRDRVDAIRRIMDAEDPTSALLFCRTRARVEELVDSLRPLGAEALHGGMGQPVREGVMKRFRDGGTRLLIATDVAARGLDVDTIQLVMHDELPGDVDTYVHRIGRTGRAGRSGMSIAFLAPGKVRRIYPFEQGRTIEEYSVPDDEELAANRAQRLITELNETETTDVARATFEQAIATGMGADELAQRLLTMLTTQPAAAPEPEVQETTGIALKVGKMDSIHPGAIVGVLTNTGGVPASDIGRIDILEKMSVVEVPTHDVERVCDALSRVRLSGRPLLPRPAEDWRFRDPNGRRPRRD